MCRLRVFDAVSLPSPNSAPDRLQFMCGGSAATRQRNCLPERFILLISTTGPTLRRHSRKRNSCLLAQAIRGTHCTQDLAASGRT